MDCFIPCCVVQNPCTTGCATMICAEICISVTLKKNMRVCMYCICGIRICEPSILRTKGHFPRICSGRTL